MRVFDEFAFEYINHLLLIIYYLTIMQTQIVDVLNQSYSTMSFSVVGCGNQKAFKPGHWYCWFTGAQAASFSHQGSRYQVEARARVIIFDIAAFEADGALRRGSSSLVSVDHPQRSFTREHGGLMSWPENLYKPREREQNCVGTCRSENSLPVRAMQLSIFGSMVCSIHLFAKICCKAPSWDHCKKCRTLEFLY